MNAWVLKGRVRILGNMLNLSGHIREDVTHLKSQKHSLFVLFKWQLPGCKDVYIFVRVLDLLPSVLFLSLPLLYIPSQGADSAGFVSQDPVTGGFWPSQANGRY